MMGRPRNPVIACTVRGCGDMACNSHGYCNPHYRRWRRYGDPLMGRIAHGAPETFFREVALAYDGDECLIWPFWRNRAGYACFRHNGKNQFVSRVVCETENGPPPTDEHDAAHSCGNGHLGCIAKRHLTWKTPADNCSDRDIHGTTARGERNGGGQKLTTSDVIKIKALRGIIPQTKIAKQFGVNSSTISAIHRGAIWSHIERATNG